eukprot:gene11116-biopygen7254
MGRGPHRAGAELGNGRALVILDGKVWQTTGQACARGEQRAQHRKALFGVVSWSALRCTWPERPGMTRLKPRRPPRVRGADPERGAAPHRRPRDADGHVDGDADAPHRLRVGDDDPPYNDGDRQRDPPVRHRDRDKHRLGDAVAVPHPPHPVGVGDGDGVGERDALPPHRVCDGDGVPPDADADGERVADGLAHAARGDADPVAVADPGGHRDGDRHAPAGDVDRNAALRDGDGDFHPPVGDGYGDGDAPERDAQRECDAPDRDGHALSDDDRVVLPPNAVALCDAPHRGRDGDRDIHAADRVRNVHPPRGVPLRIRDDDARGGYAVVLAADRV